MPKNALDSNAQHAEGNDRCPVCEKATFTKRWLGWGTYFAVVLTAGLWLLALPFYPKRCVVCGTAYSPKTARTPVLSVCAILFALLAVSNLLKPFQFGGQQTGFVFFGNRLSGVANSIIGPLFGIFLAAYAYGIWTMKRFAMAMGHAYATYVILNLILFNFRNTVPDTTSYQIFGIVYAAIAIGVSLGAAVLLTQRKAELT